MHFCSKAAPAALGGCGGLGQLWEALAELWEALGELWEALYIEKIPINRTSGRYVYKTYLNYFQTFKSSNIQGLKIFPCSHVIRISECLNDRSFGKEIKHSSIENFKHSNIQALKHSNSQCLKLQSFKDSRFTYSNLQCLNITYHFY